MGRATQDLRNEHDAILFVLRILDKMLQSDGFDSQVLLRYCREVVDFLKIFVDKCHHGKEEEYLFKELVVKGIPNEGGPIGVMLEEHARGREYIAQMSRGLAGGDIGAFGRAAAQYAELLRRHIEKENSVLFTLADQVIDGQEQNELFDLFERHEENVIGHGVHERLHAMIDEWADTFEVE